MKFKIKELFLTIVGVFFILLGILAFYNGIRNFGISGVLWFSYTALFLIGVGIATRNSYLIGSQLNIIFIPYIIWNVDFFYVLTTGNSLWGITNYFFEPRQSLAQLITLQHIFIIPISLLVLYLIKLKREDFWKFSVVQVVIFFILVRLITETEKNVNCAFSNCLPFYVNPLLYVLGWFLAYGIMIFLTTFLLTKIKVFNKNRKTYKK